MLLLVIGLQFISYASKSLQTADVEYFTTAPVSASASTYGPPDWNFGTSNDAFYLARDGLGAFEKVNSTSSLIYNNNVTQIGVNIAKVNDPKGTLTIGRYNSAGVLQTTYGTVNASSLSTTPILYDYSLASGSIVQSGDQIGVKYVDNGRNPIGSYVTPMNFTTGTGTFNMNAGGNIIECEKVNTNSSALYNKSVNTFIHRMAKIGSPTGAIIAGIWNMNSTSSTPVYTFGTADISKITTAQTEFAFYNATASFTMQLNHCAGVEFNGGDGSNRLTSITDSAGGFNGTASARGALSGITWTTNTSVDLRAIITKFTPPDADAHYGVTLDGINDFGYLPVTTIFANQTNNLSVIAWITPTKFGTQSIISNYRSATDGWEVSLGPNNTPGLEFRAANDAQSREYRSRYQLTTGIEHYIAVSYNGTHTVFYVDDQLDNRGFTGTYSIKINPDQMLRIGDRQSIPEKFQGTISKLQVWNRTLSNNELTLAYRGIEPSSTNLLLNYTFSEGLGVMAIDSSSNHYNAVITNNSVPNFSEIYTTQSDPNFVRIGVDSTRSFDNRYTLTDPIHGDKHTWIFNINNDLTNLNINTHSVLNMTVLNDLVNRGIDTVYLAGVNAEFNNGAPIYTNVWLPWIAAAHANGLKVYAVSFETTAVLNSTYYANDYALLRSQYSDILDVAAPYFDGWTTNIEPNSLADWTTNKAFYLERMVNVTNVLGETAHIYGKQFYQTIEATSDDANTASLTMYHSGIDNMTSADAVIFEDYKYNSTSAYSDAAAIFNIREKPQIYLLSLRDVGGSPKLTTSEWQRMQALLSDAHDQGKPVLGVGAYSVDAFRAKTDTVYNKNSFMSWLNNTSGYSTIQKDIVGTVQTVNQYPPSNALDGNLTSYWQNGVQKGTSDYIVGQLSESRQLLGVRIYTPDPYAIPATVNIYTSQDGITWTLASSNAILTQAVGYHTLNIPAGANGQYVKIQPSSYNPQTYSFKVSEIDVNYYTSTPTEGGIAFNEVVATYSVIVVVILLLSILFIFPKYVTIE